MSENKSRYPGLAEAAALHNTKNPIDIGCRLLMSWVGVLPENEEKRPPDDRIAALLTKNEIGPWRALMEYVGDDKTTFTRDDAAATAQEDVANGTVGALAFIHALVTEAEVLGMDLKEYLLAQREIEEKAGPELWKARVSSETLELVQHYLDRVAGTAMMCRLDTFLKNAWAKEDAAIVTDADTAAAAATPK